MKPDSMKIPPLAELYQQKHGYQVHRRKLQKIMSDRKNHLLMEVVKEGNPRRYSNNNFERRYNTKSLEIARANSKIVKKIEKVKPSFSFKCPDRKISQSRASQSLGSKTRLLEQEKENYRIREKVKSMSSSLNKQVLMKDYQRSMQIKNRIMHFKTSVNNKVVLKINRYLDNSSYLQNSRVSAKKSITQPDSLPRIPASHSLSKQIILSQKLNKEMIDKKLGKMSSNLASYYKKDDILKHKIPHNNKLFKMAREKRAQAMTQLQNKQRDIKGKQPMRQESQTIFPTEIQKQK